MSLNTAHANNGVLIHSGEAILLYSENVSMEFSGQDNAAFKGTKTGKIYLTTHRMIYNTKNFQSDDYLKSFSFPFVCLTDVEVEQPLFGANYIRGKVRAQENGNFVGEVKFKLLFKSGGAIEFSTAMLRAAHMAKQNSSGLAPPPYTPTNQWHDAPPPAYNASGYYGWLPNQPQYFQNPAPNSVYMSDDPPPYPGISPQQQPQQQPQQPPPSYGGQYPPYGGQPQSPPYGSQPQYPGYGGQQPPYPQSPPYGSQPQYPGYGGQQPPNYPQPPYGGGYPQPAHNMYPQVPQVPQVPQATGGGPAPNPSKEAEAAQSAYNNNPYNNPTQNYGPSAPGYNEPPPNYGSLNFWRPDQNKDKTN